MEVSLQVGDHLAQQVRETVGLSLILPEQIADLRCGVATLSHVGGVNHATEMFVHVATMHHEFQECRVVDAAGLAVNLISMRILSAGKGASLNVRGAYLEVWSDMLGSLGVIVAAAVIALTGWNWIDPVVAIGIGLWVLPRGWRLLKETTNVLLEGVPEGLDMEEVAPALALVPGVRDLHDLPIWALTSDAPSLSAHVVVDAESETETVRAAVQAMLEERFHITHVTLQTERTDCRAQRPHHGLH